MRWQRMMISGGATLAGALVLAACGSGTATEEDQDDTGAVVDDGEEVGATPEPADTPDPAARFRNTWPETDFSQVTVDLDEIKSGGVPIDGIPPLDAEGATTLEARRSGEANFAPVGDVDYEGQLPVAFIEVGGEARAYPLHILTWHEIVNDVVGGTPVAVTFCPLCNTVLAFDRDVDGDVLDFGVSGLLRHSDLVMWDRQTHSWWQQATGQGIAGEHASTQLRILGAGIISFEDFRNRFPDALVLTEDTGMGRTYGQNPYIGYDNIGSFPFLFDGEIDERLPAMERVVSLGDADEGLAVPFSLLQELHIANVEVAATEAVVLWAPGTTSALDELEIAEAADIGSAIAYSPVVDGQRLTFEPGDEPGTFRDAETGSTWNIGGEAIDGPLAGTAMEIVPHTNIFWFAWAAFVPDTDIWEG